MAQSPERELSDSVRRALSRFKDDEPVRSWDITREILRLHGEYGEGGGERAMNTEWPAGETRLVSDWIRALDDLLDPQRAPVLHGRLMILALSELDPGLRKHLEEVGIYQPLLEEMKEPLQPLFRRQESSRTQAAYGIAPVEQSVPAAVEPQSAAEGQSAAEVQPVAESQPEGEKPPPEGNVDELLKGFDAYTQFLLVAAAVVREFTPPVPDTLLLLSAITNFSIGERPESMNLSEADTACADALTQEMMRQRFPNRTLEGGTPPAFKAPTEVNDGPITTIELLGYENWNPEDRDIQSLPSLDELTGELAVVHQAALQFAERARPGRAPKPAHLMAVLLAPRLASPAPGVQSHLLHLGYDLAGLRRALLDATRQHLAGEDLSAWESALLARDYLPPIAGYISDYVRDDQADRLNIEDEVANIASVLTYKEVSPPLALGLFGDWGSGKTFFMNKLNKAIDDCAAYYLDQEQTTRQPAHWCSRVVQIFFNAWNYSDTNLWAGLVTRIYEALYDELNDQDEKDRAYKEEIEKKVAEAKGAVSESQAQKELAGERVRKAHTALVEAQKARQEKENSLRLLVDDLSVLLESTSKEKLKKATAALGYPQAAKTYEELKSLNEDLQSFSSRSSALLLNSFRSHWTLAILALCVIVLPLLVTVIVENAMPFLGTVGQRVTEISVFITGLLASLKFQIDRGMGWVWQIESAFEQAQKVRQERLQAGSEKDPVKIARDELVLAESQEQAATANLQSAQLELQRLQSELAELRPDRRFYRLIEERSQSTAYQQYLGIISLIRTDFDEISRLMTDMAKEGDKRDLANETPPIQRIILYIDDLDRCRPERVVEVLEAVHLLLAFPLFVVVVGVDPRWLHQSLSKHYSATISEGGSPDAADGRILSGFATPQDYLEKIFQIPYALRPVERSGYENLVTDLLGPVGAERRTGMPGAGGQGVTSNGGSARTNGSSNGAKIAAETPGTPAAGLAGQPVTSPSAAGPHPEKTEQVKPIQRRAKPDLSHFTPLTNDQLSFTDAEKKDILLLWPLFRTPRTIKRYINLYRLLRASLRSQREVALFEGTPEQVGEYRVAMMLLAVMTSFPNQGAELLKMLDEWFESRQPDECFYWLDFVHEQRIKRAATRRPSTDLPDPVPNPPPGEVNDTITEEVQGEMSWDRLLDAIEQVCRAGNFDPASSEILRRWAVRVSRYSFSIK